ncbi:uncharacterized protein LOC116287487 isoform X2 [Actinia tenebrosa]|uniref:Uncharacterized protein LOC116287487 isoform X2 n=1 Tax=Actinia tenebrosa TaxID=6105 RepID=A0A6P8H0S8_ACTTE|nr:uncharacterized protein LOC116287487 isoform X2 [Actinia tenebrosa]
MLYSFIGLFMILSVLVEGKWKCSECKIQYKAVGCFKDDGQRPLPREILNERDVTSKVFGHRMIDWYDWDNYIAGFACRCAAKAKSLGYKVFGLQFFGECWSGPDAKSYKAVGKADNKKCTGNEYKTCSPFSRHCVGQQFTNFIYEIVPDCDIPIESLGCYSDRHIKGARPFPNYVLTDRVDSTRGDIFTHVLLDWRNWDTYMPQLACRCAKKAKSLGHTTFGVQYYGECWTGNNADYTYDRDKSSKNCIDKCYEPCKPYEKYCSGKQFANYVYRLSGPEVPCELNTTPLGCFAENPSSRALGVEIQNEIDPTSRVFRGNVFEIKEWDKQFPSLLCRCARAAKQKGFSVFGVYNNATCWGGPDGHSTYNKHGESSQCIKGTEPCPGNSVKCAGGDKSIFVYKVSRPHSKRSFDSHFKKEDTMIDDLFGKI